MKKLLIISTTVASSIITTSMFGMLTTRCLTRLIRPNFFTAQAQSTVDSSKQDIQEILYGAYIEHDWARNKRRLNALITLDNVDTPENNTTGYTPLCYALRYNDLNFARSLLEKGANPNLELKEVPGSRPIFFAKTPEAVQLLEEYGADISQKNDCGGVTHGMDMLHASIGCNTKNDRMFDHFLERGLDPKNIDATGRTLWHSLVWISARTFPEKQLLERAKKLRTLGINPHQKCIDGRSAVDMVKESIAYMEPHINSGNADKNDIDNQNKMIRLLALMTESE